MNKETLKIAKMEAKKFLKLAKEMEDRVLDEDFTFSTPTVESGALRRCSMDLTRALAQLRKRND